MRADGWGDGFLRPKRHGEDVSDRCGRLVHPEQRGKGGRNIHRRDPVVVSARHKC